MYDSNQAETVEIKPCRSCGIALFDQCRFCRSCGAPQTATLLPLSQGTVTVTNEPGHQTYVTKPLSDNRLYHPVSGPLVSAVVAGVPAREQLSPASSFSKRTLLALMAIPIWVMIILLSPLDAYASAKIIGSRI